MAKMNALVVETGENGPLMKPGEFKKPSPGINELLVKVEATALNRADLLQKSGKYPPPKGSSPLLGLEMAGIVENCSDSCRTFKPGDRVFGLLTGGGYAEYCTIPESHAMRMPDFLSFEEAAAIPEVFLTAYQALIWLGDLSNSETVLIHAGASGVGTAAIQIARQLKNARIVTTSGSDHKQSICKNLGAELSINYKKQNFAREIVQQFGEDSINLIIDFVGKPYWKKNIDVLSMDGRLILLALLGGTRPGDPSLAPILRKRLTIKGSTLRNRPVQYKSDLTSEFESKCLPLFSNGSIKPIIDSVYNWKDVEEAHSKMANNKNAGKIILTGM